MRVLKCHAKGMKCPPYSHQGRFVINNQTLKQFQPDLQRCANCMACQSPQLPDFRDDLIQVGNIILLKKGPKYQPDHKSGASFGSFIRPRICGGLTDERNKELKQRRRYLLSDSETRYENQDEIAAARLLRDTLYPERAFEDELVWELQLSAFEDRLPTMLPRLTPREQQVFELIRVGTQRRDIATTLSISETRISQISTQIVKKLKKACREFGIIEGGSTYI